MVTQRYSVVSHPIETILSWIKSGEIGVPEMQRPFVWENTKVRNLLDSLYQGYPVGYLITWRNPTVKLKDGTLSAGKRILIDGQQRVTALRASLLGCEVQTKDYKKVRIQIAFHPQEERFEVANSAILKDPAWISDITAIFDPATSIFQLVTGYCQNNPGVSQDVIFAAIEKLRKIVNTHVGVIELAHDLDIETVTEIFIRVNSAGADLSQADFAMSKIAVNETYGGNLLRRAIDYFCELSANPESLSSIEKHDPEFTASEFFPAMRWRGDVNENIYVPSYTDMLRVAFTSEFERGKLHDLVALLSGRNFETREFEEAISEASFERLKKGILAFVNRTHFERITMILRSAGFVTGDLLGGQTAVNFAYILYLRGRKEGISAANLERLVRRWYVMSLLSTRYTGNPETVFDFDIRQIRDHGLEHYCDKVIQSELSDSFWTGLLPQLMNTSSTRSPYFLAWQAAQAKLGDKGFLSRDNTVRDILLSQSQRNIHHIYPQKYLQKQGLARGRYNQIANFVVTQSDINSAIKDKSPEQYFAELREQVRGGPKRYGGITDEVELRANLRANCVPESLLDGCVPDYDRFLDERRTLMALKIKSWFEQL